MWNPLRDLLVLAALSALVACTSNPTPHPGSNDGFDTGQTVDTATAGAGDKRELCEDLGGAYADDEVCDIDLDSAFDGEPSPPIGQASPRADVVGVVVAGGSGSYTFDVTIESGDSGCDSYADWWEVVTFAGELRYRRILTHSHVDEQPFTRSGGPIAVYGDEPIVVRAHRHPEGYIGDAWVGTVDDGLVRARLPEDFATALADDDPLPTGCAF